MRPLAFVTGADTGWFSLRSEEEEDADLEADGDEEWELHESSECGGDGVWV